MEDNNLLIFSSPFPTKLAILETDEIICFESNTWLNNKIFEGWSNGDGSEMYGITQQCTATCLDNSDIDIAHFAHPIEVKKSTFYIGLDVIRELNYFFYWMFLH